MTRIIYKRWPCGHAFSNPALQTHLKFCLISFFNRLTKYWSLTEVSFPVRRRHNYTTLALHCAVTVAIRFSPHSLHYTRVEFPLISRQLLISACCICHYMYVYCYQLMAVSSLRNGPWLFITKWEMYVNTETYCVKALCCTYV
jgi:hypothetical protein